MKRVTLTGVESTGKSLLAPVLAAKFGGVVMPEHGRQWAETRGLDFTIDALRSIAAGHIAERSAIEAQQPALIVEDTDIVMTSAWARMLHGARDPVLTAIPATGNLYLLFAADTPWVGDGTRQFGGNERSRFNAIIADEFEQRGIVPVAVTGSWDARYTAAAAAVAALLASSDPS